MAVLGLCASLLMAPAGASPLSGGAAAVEPAPTISGRITAEDFDLAAYAAESPLRVEALVWDDEGEDLVVVSSVDTKGSGSSGRIQSDGTYTISVPRPHQVVVLEFSQDRCLHGWGDPCDSRAAPDIPAPKVKGAYWDGTTYGLLSSTGVADAGISVGSGSVVDKNITLRKSKKVNATVRPRVVGDPSPGTVLRARYGTYVPATWDETFQWLIRDNSVRGAYEVVELGPTLKVSPKYLGRRIALLAFPKVFDHEVPILQTSDLIVRSRSKFAVKAKAGQRKATVTIAIKAPGVAKSRVHGKASIYAKGKRIKTVNVKNGKATIKIAKQRKGKRTYTVRYSGNRIITSSTKSLKIRIR